VRKPTAPRLLSALIVILAHASTACAQSLAKGAPNDHISVRAIAEVESKLSQNGRQVSKLTPADRVVPGDQIIYTLEIRNTGAMPVAAPAVDYPVPEHTRYVANSASGPGAEISYSIDGGHTYDRPENLKISDEQGVKQVAGPGAYTHIRWQLKNTLKVNSVAFARFRAVVK
jgi:uncharacterized repeat protein (TIGR01451 family)